MSEVPWTRVQQTTVLNAIDLAREKLAEQGMGPAAGMAEFMAQARAGQEALVEQVAGLNQLVVLILKRIEREFGEEPSETLKLIAAEVRDKPLSKPQR